VVYVATHGDLEKLELQALLNVLEPEIQRVGGQDRGTNCRARYNAHDRIRVLETRVS